MARKLRFLILLFPICLFILATCAPGPNVQNLIPPTPTPCVTATPASAAPPASGGSGTTLAGTSLPQEGSSTQPTLSADQQATLEAGLQRANPGGPFPVCPTPSPTPQK